MQESFWNPRDDMPFAKRYRMGRLTSQRNHAESLYHWHEVFEIYHVFKGEFTLNCDGNEIRLMKGDTYFVNWCIPHQDIKYIKDTMAYSYRIDGALLGSVANELKLRHLENVLFKNDNDFVALFTTLLEINEKNDIYSELEINRLLIKMVLNVLEKNKDNNNVKKEDSKKFIIFKQIFVYIKNHLDENISLDKLSSELGLHKNYLCRVFKEQTGYSIVSYFNITRAHQAINMINSNIPLSEISDSLGFCDYNYFSRAFKKAMGHSPSHYLKNKEK